MSSESNAEAGQTLLIEIFPHPAHFFGRAGETVDQQARRL